jgi:hypothetical protein
MPNEKETSQVTSEPDFSQVPRGILAARSFLNAIAKQGDLAERHYLELKSQLDLSTKKDKEKIAKFILGAANRMPEIAVDAFEGYAIMVVGISEGVVTGITPVEVMEIAKVVQPFVGAGGPHWDVMWVPIESSSNQILFVIVSPPVAGQGPFVCRTNGTSLTNGRIYIRAEGETREANAEEVDQLLKRGSEASKLEIDFAVELIGDISFFALDSRRTIEAYLEMQRGQLLAALPSKEVGPSRFDLGINSFTSLASSLNSASLLANSTLIPESRTEETYLASIRKWEERFRVAWEEAVPKIAASQLMPIIVKIRNCTKTFFHDVEIKLHLEGDVHAHEFVDNNLSNLFSQLELPHPPRPWGPQTRDFGIPNYANISYVQPSFPSTFNSPSVSFKNGGSVDLHLNVGELRPLGNYESEQEEFVLYTSTRSLKSVHGTWELTARDHNDVFMGEFDVPISDEVDITAAARKVLSLKNEVGS